MKFRDPHSETGETVILWGEHYNQCKKCADVVLDRPATFALTCAQGAPLLMEELAKRQAPEVRRQRQEVEEWAKKVGVFKIGKNGPVQTRYKGEG